MAMMQISEGDTIVAPGRHLWKITMGDVGWRVIAHGYEEAVAKFEAWLILRNIERRGAEFEVVR